MNTKEEIKETAEEIANNPSDYNYELYNLAKAYLDIANAEPAVEVGAISSISILGNYALLAVEVNITSVLKVGDKLYLRKE